MPENVDFDVFIMLGKALKQRKFVTQNKQTIITIFMSEIKAMLGCKGMPTITEILI